MRTTRARQLTSILLLLVVAPLSPAMAWHCGDHPEQGEMGPGDDCSEGAEGEVHRCAGLWSSACCDFSSPARPTHDVPGGFGLHTRGVSVLVAELATVLSLPPLAHSTLDRLVEDRAGPPPARLLTSVLLI
jgi:hypothetical protein